MNKSIEQSLHTLLPSYSSSLPPELLNLATSLLAQSRSKASTLKSEEEIARPYACAHLACERLKSKFNLPDIVSNPPVPPPKYKKLYSYLDTALASRPSRAANQERNVAPTTPSKIRTTGKVNGNGTPSKATPSKAATPSGTPAKGTPASRRHTSTLKRKAPTETDLPPWTMPTIRTLCAAFSKPSAAPHVFAGVASVMSLQPPSARDPDLGPSTPSKRRRRESGNQNGNTNADVAISTSQIPALIAVILFFVLTKMSGSTTGKEYRAQQSLAVSTLLGLANEETGLETEMEESELSDTIEHLLRVAMDKGWTDMEWYQNVSSHSNPESEAEGEAGDDGDEMDLDEDGNETRAARRRSISRTPRKKMKHSMVEFDDGRLQMGLGTMFCEAVDWLSEERRLDYEEWKDDVLVRIEKMERGRGAVGLWK
ncbi:hypothetical protein K402DRAFT_390891 [Aulographum hederae CBS 113979]|uniref:ORC6 first cyclin-like domain-containing protein n=1 Tax=Aulographum hederae CBS 113979 TaxID=1176131 RepID=A0A6G1H8C6_9PEZI|nr:hypothetical protein K402DRAFT_390891 [Aulographum hederae CBS 113979]